MSESAKSLPDQGICLLAPFAKVGDHHAARLAGSQLNDGTGQFLLGQLNQLAEREAAVDKIGEADFQVVACLFHERLHLRVVDQLADLRGCELLVDLVRLDEFPEQPRPGRH